MNKLPLEKRVQIINLLVEGSSMRATSRITGTSINTAVSYTHLKRGLNFRNPGDRKQ